MTRSANWDDFVSRHGVGDVVDGLVTKLVPFGVFVTVHGDIPGLLVTEARPKVGSTLPVRVKELDGAKQRIAFETV
ncbi:S1 RNA-binding domain-containing protein [Dactylosporangium sp. NPDC048998]|uniref:S1 RNA-binding domain-containing protein n=1 Tax=Dactylosporangium sp. NPDC048998 TaxID=3363976 RepID=UPI0037123B58